MKNIFASLNILIDKLILIGIDPSYSKDKIRKIRLSNQINLVLAVIMFALFWVDYIQTGQFDLGSDIFFYVIILTSFNILLNALKKNWLSRISLIFFTPYVLLFMVLQIRGSAEDYYIFYPYTPIPFFIMPHFLFNIKKEKGIFVLHFLYCAVMILFCREILEFYSVEKGDFEVSQLVNKIILFYRLIPFFTGAFIYFSIFYLTKENTTYENSLEDAYQKLKKQGEKLQEYNKIISTQNTEILSQNEELKAQQENLSEKNEALEKAMEKLKHAQSHLVQSEKLSSLGLLTAGIAHEINNPINYIKNGIIGLKKGLAKLTIIIKEYDKLNETNQTQILEKVNLLKSNIKYDDLLITTLKVASNIVTGAQRTSEIVNSLKSFSRAGEDNRSRANLHDDIESTLLLLSHQHKNRLKIIKKYGDIPFVNCNHGKISQVFMNILSNAMDALTDQADGEIVIETSSNKSEVIIAISDNGPGIPDEVKSKIFEPFYTTKGDGKGTGLGLSISLNIIKEHDGKIELENLQGRSGTKFIVHLPITPLKIT